MRAIPILKIGAVILRVRDSAVLIVQPKPKTEGEIPPYVLPRGSRQYAVTKNGKTEWHDARDEATGVKHEATLEPYARALAREIEEEAGITPAQLAAAQVVDLGPMDFKSRTKGIYPIQWFMVVPDEATVKTLTHTIPADALSTRWANFEAIIKLDDIGKFSTGYIPVIAAALREVSRAAQAFRPQYDT